MSPRLETQGSGRESRETGRGREIEKETLVVALLAAEKVKINTKCIINYKNSNSSSSAVKVIAHVWATFALATPATF